MCSFSSLYVSGSSQDPSLKETGGGWVRWLKLTDLSLTPAEGRELTTPKLPDLHVCATACVEPFPMYTPIWQGIWFPYHPFALRPDMETVSAEPTGLTH